MSYSRRNNTDSENKDRKCFPPEGSELLFSTGAITLRFLTAEELEAALKEHKPDNGTVLLPAETEWGTVTIEVPLKLFKRDVEEKGE